MTGTRDLTAVKAMLFAALNDALPDRAGVEFLPAGHEDLTFEPTTPDAVMIEVGDCYYNTELDLTKLAATVMEWFAARLQTPEEVAQTVYEVFYPGPIAGARDRVAKAICERQLAKIAPKPPHDPGAA